MDRIQLCNKTYSGDLIFEKTKENISISIYVLNPAVDKYLILNKRNNIVNDFIITGIHKIYYIIEIMKGNTTIAELEKQINTELYQLKSKCQVKKIKRIDMQKFQDLTNSYYDENYHMFVVLGMRFQDLLDKAEREMGY